MSRIIRCAMLALAAAIALATSEPAADTTRLQGALATVRFVAYTPRGFDPGAGGPPPSAAALRADLELLRPHFDGLVTYSSANGLDRLPALAREAGFRAVVLGVWSPGDSRELAAALAAAAAEPGIVVGLAIGNEGLFFRRYDAATLAGAFARARRARPALPLSTSEPFAGYLDAARAQSLPKLDFLLPNIHPTNEPWFDGAPLRASIELVVNVVSELEQRFGLPVLVKETGLPSGPAGDGFSESAQAAFWSALAQRLPPTKRHAFAWFEAFDSPWKPARTTEAPPEKRAREAFWGFVDQDGRPKSALEAVLPATRE
jgi:exo-beta-1,3-glucanase (GH17 family)